MTKQIKKAYEAPMVEVMNARIEKGFAGSSTEGGDGTLPPIDGGERELPDFD